MAARIPDAESGSSPAPEVPPYSPRPPHRRLRVFALDPSLSSEFATSGLAEITLLVPWEVDQEGNNALLPGPVGRYLEVVDVDPASGLFYEPVDLDDPHLLASDGLAPSITLPQFHQQMVYAVATVTIRHFEDALGRAALWADRHFRDEEGTWKREFVERLRIYPHALRDANAFYSPQRKALLFGYFPAVPEDPRSVAVPGSTIFTCLSYDVIAHETAHALLDGLHRRYTEPTNPDVLALHEAFADIVAIFQHFGHAELLRSEIARAGGRLESGNLLAGLAREIGLGLGKRGALRSALDDEGEGEGEADFPVGLNDVTLEPHERGAVLVAAVFDAFLSIYRARIEDLLRIASGGSGLLPAGELQPDLVNRMAREASRVSRQVLRMCIRALDYCPPVDPDFGDYLRALITADLELVPYDDRNYRVAFIEAFRRRAILPRGLRGLAEESLRWLPPATPLPSQAIDPLFDTLRDVESESSIEDLARLWNLSNDRGEIWDAARRSRGRFKNQILEHWTDHWDDWVAEGTVDREWIRRELHLVTDSELASLYRDQKGRPATEVHSLRVARRRGPRDESLVELVIEVTQRRRGYFDVDQQRRADAGKVDFEKEPPDFVFRSGCTLLVDLATRELRYAIRSPGPVDNDSALDRQRRFRRHFEGRLRTSFTRTPREEREIFAISHRPPRRRAE